MQNYTITPLAHIKLLSGKKILSDAGGDISDSYYLFSFKSKTNDTEEIIYCGKPTAQDFCKMTNQKLPILFNPLKSEAKINNKSKQTSINTNTINWNKTRLQLYNATMLLITVFDAIPNTPLFAIKEELETYVAYEPFLSRIKAINTIIRNSKKTLRDYIEELSKDNNLKEYSFDLLVSKLKENKIQQYFENESNKT